MNTHRAYMAADTTVTCWARNAEGAVDFGDATLTALVYHYARQGKPVELGVTTFPGSSGDDPQVGRADFTVTEAIAEQQLSPGLYRFEIKSDEQGVVYGGLLEMV